MAGLGITCYAMKIDGAVAEISGEKPLKFMIFTVVSAVVWAHISSRSSYLGRSTRRSITSLRYATVA
jgi:hypothetical protein